MVVNTRGWRSSRQNTQVHHASFKQWLPFSVASFSQLLFLLLSVKYYQHFILNI